SSGNGRANSHSSPPPPPPPPAAGGNDGHGSSGSGGSGPPSDTSRPPPSGENNGPAGAGDGGQVAPASTPVLVSQGTFDIAVDPASLLTNGRSHSAPTKGAEVLLAADLDVSADTATIEDGAIVLQAAPHTPGNGNGNGNGNGQGQGQSNGNHGGGAGDKVPPGDPCAHA